ncbi:hypothetical protein WISP_79845 [Willisornis vidua]|uniref:Reverse transcriptase domain-containing protein n=1 Tax=Willisornis vidua TaxID=1566151 RepID=A0ABQ9D9P1_9PASS|nr:hypothetical protein WISP_79845 [Willisornis vidua]
MEISDYLIPQRPLQRPVLFNDFINNIDTVTECTFSRFPDDTNLGGAVDTPEGKDAIHRNLDKLKKWILDLGWGNSEYQYRMRSKCSKSNKQCGLAAQKGNHILSCTPSSAVRQSPSCWAKGNITAMFQKRRKEDRDLQTGESELCDWEGQEADPHRDNVKAMQDKTMIQASQQGFTEGKSFLITLVAFYDGVAATVDKRRLTFLMYLDFCKAFDTIPHNTIISKL